MLPLGSSCHALSIRAVGGRVKVLDVSPAALRSPTSARIRDRRRGPRPGYVKILKTRENSRRSPTTVYAGSSQGFYPPTRSCATNTAGDAER